MGGTDQFSNILRRPTFPLHYSLHGCRNAPSKSFIGRKHNAQDASPGCRHLFSLVGSSVRPERHVGTWDYVSAETVAPDGKRSPTFGPKPKGIVVFEANGRYALIVTRSDQPKFASNNRLQGTPEENKAIVQGSISHFGTYAVNEADKTITFHIQTSTFPNWDGMDQKRPFTLSGDELKYTVPAASGGGGSAEVLLERLK